MVSDEATRESQNTILEQYEMMGVTKAIFSAVLDTKTCIKCLALNRKIYTLKDAKGVIPVHNNCRCMWVPLRAGQLFGAEYPIKSRRKGQELMTAEDIMFFI